MTTKKNHPASAANPAAAPDLAPAEKPTPKPAPKPARPLTEPERAAEAWDQARANQVDAAKSAHAAGAAAGYTVQPGDTLESIAAAIYGSDELAGDLYDANSAVIGSTPAVLLPGTVLAVPAPSTTPADAPAD